MNERFPARAIVAVLGLMVFLFSGCEEGKPSGSSPDPTATPAGKGEPEATPRVVESREGIATWYEVPDGSLAERRGSADDGLTAAHRDLPIGTRVRVKNQETGAQVTVEITDRGIGRNPEIDVSKAAAKELGMVEEGKVPVTLEVLENSAKRD